MAYVDEIYLFAEKNRALHELVFTFIKKAFILTMQQFIFSNNIKLRLARHLAFWGIYYIYTVFTNLPDVKIKTLTDPQLYRDALFDALEFLPVYLFSVYFSLYFVLPKYLAK